MKTELEEYAECIAPFEHAVLVYTPVEKDGEVQYACHLHKSETPIGIQVWDGEKFLTVFDTEDWEKIK